MQEPVDAAARDHAIAAARGLEPFDVLLAGGTLVDVATGELRLADVGFAGPLIASVHDPGSRHDAVATVDCSGRYVAPGFMDMHVHFESSMLTPAAYAEAVVPRGTTTVFADPHELGNAAGMAGVRYAVEASRGLPLRFVLQAPSCVPPVPGYESSHSDFMGPELEAMLAWPEMGGVAEVMDMGGVLERDRRMVEVVDAGLRSGKLVSGHAVGLTGAELQGYLCAGITSDHEIMMGVDAVEKLRAGMTVELRGILDFVISDLVPELARLPMVPTNLVICTDDLFADHLLRVGGIDDVLRHVIAAGLDPVQAIRCATVNGAYRLGRTDLGLVGPGRRADVVVMSDLEQIAVDEVFAGGRLVASGQKMLEPIDAPIASAPLDTMLVPPLTPADFEIPVPGVEDGTATVRAIAGVILFAKFKEIEVAVRDGVVVLPEGTVRQAVVHRYGRAPSTPKVGVLLDWGTWRGAVATSVSHDTHNLVVFGVDPVDMAAAANAVISASGGVAVASGGEVRAIVALPIAGLLAPGSAESVARAQRELNAAFAEIADFVSLMPQQPIMQTMVSSLACIPGAHVTDLGLVDVTTGSRYETSLVDA